VKSNSKQATKNKELKAEQRSESSELKRVQAASNRKYNDKQGQGERYYETTKITRGLTKLINHPKSV